MKNLYLFFLIITNIACADPQIPADLKIQLGIVDPITANLQIDNFSDQSPEIQKTNQKLISLIRSRFNSINPNLLKQITGTQNLSTYNANPTLIQWTKQDSQILHTLQNQEIQAESDPNFSKLNASATHTAPTITNRNYILVGFITKIDARQNIKAIPTTSIKSVIYNGEIWITYLVVDVQTKHTVAHFIAVGRGSSAVLMPSTDTPYTNYDVIAITNAIFSGLANNTKILLFKHLK